MATKAEARIPAYLDGLTEGRIVHYVSGDPSAPCRAAMVVRIARLRGPDVEVARDADDGTPVVRPTFTLPDSGNCNLTLFTDWENDSSHLPMQMQSGTVHKTSVLYAPFPTDGIDEPAVGTWHRAQEHV